jgi:ubiquinone/menaquinone biosynthesis C-methylase UbiE
MATHRATLSRGRFAALADALCQSPSDPANHQRCAAAIDAYFSEGGPSAEGAPPSLAFILETLLDHDAVKHQHLAYPAAVLLKERFEIDNGAAPAVGLARRLATDHLFLIFLEKTINVDIELEGFLGKLRRFLLCRYKERGCLDAPLPRLAAALAQQCFNNEYIFQEGEEEEQWVEAVVETMEGAPDRREGAFQASALFVIGMYQPIHRLASAESLRRIPLDDLPGPASPFIRRLIHEPLAEEALRRGIPSFGKRCCKTSRKVRSQYEESPYPRWVQLGGGFSSLRQRVAGMNPEVEWPFGDAPLRFLVPGCGTGQQPLSIAAGNPRAGITAVDLSQTSLAFAKRMAGRLGIDNVTFLQGDLLDVPELGDRFHHIACTGVLHHLADPDAGWRALERVLLPGGVIHVAVYSRLARAPVELLRHQMALSEPPADRQAIKRLRTALMTDSRYEPLVRSVAGYDFFSLSTFRDLLFPAREHAYTLTEIREIIDRFGFRFIGFRIGSPPLEREYRNRFPDDPRMNRFDHWQRFERHYLGTRLMFDFWLRKPMP